MGFILDLRYALRLLAKSPKFTILTSFILMGGLTVSLMTFNFVYTMALKPLDTPEGDSIVSVEVGGQYPDDLVLARDIAAVDGQMLERLYSEYAFVYGDTARLSSDGVGMTTKIERVSTNFFDLTRSQPMLGRNFIEQDGEMGGNNIMAISFRVWQSVFNGDQNIIGKAVQLDNQPFEVVAVMPKGYRLPINADLWLPTNMDFWRQQHQQPSLVRILARLNEQTSRSQANSAWADFLYEQTYQSLSLADKADFEAVTVKHLSIPEHHLSGSAGSLFLSLQGIAFAILLMAGINTGNLIFARSIERQKESAIRAALGAKQNRLVRQLVCEGGLVTIIGGFLAILLSGWLIDVLNKAMHANNDGYMPFWFVWQLDWQTILVGLLFMLTTFVFACVLPALKAANLDINGILRDGTRGALGKGAGRISRILVTVQVSLIACLMLTGSLGVVLMNKIADAVTTKALIHRYDAEFELAMPDRGQFVQNMLQSLKAQPNIVDTGIHENQGARNIRIGGTQLNNGIDIIGTSGNAQMFDVNVIKGRYIDLRDNENSHRVAMVSESFAKRHWPKVDPLKQQLDVEFDGQFVPHQVVAVVSDLAYNTQGVFAEKTAYDEIHLSYYQFPYTHVQLTMITTDDVERGKQDFYNVLYQYNAKPMLRDFEDKQTSGDAFLKIIRLMTNIIIYSGLFSLFLALMGVFGVAASSVAMRRQEVGVRRAIGAKDRAIILLFLKRNMLPLSIGLLIGLAVYSAVSFVFNNLVGSRIEVSTYVSIALVSSLMLSFILAMAAYFPTRSAIEKEPFETLRAD